LAHEITTEISSSNILIYTSVILRNPLHPFIGQRPQGKSNAMNGETNGTVRGDYFDQAYVSDASSFD